MHLIQHPLRQSFNQYYPVQTVLRDLASQENCNGEPYDQMITAAEYIDELERLLMERTDELNFIRETLGYERLPS